MGLAGIVTTASQGRPVGVARPLRLPHGACARPALMMTQQQQQQGSLTRGLPRFLLARQPRAGAFWNFPPNCRPDERPPPPRSP